MRVRITLRHVLRTLVALLAVSTASGAAYAQDVLVSMDESKDACGVRGEFHAAVKDSVAWATLTDYENISRFVRSVKTSHVEQRAPGRILLRQEAVGGMFIFHRRVKVLLEITEEPGRSIKFRDISLVDFEHHVGQWRIASEGAGVRVRYELAAEPRSGLPKSLCRGMLRRMARSLLEEVRDEMLRRSSANRGDGGRAGPTSGARIGTDEAALDAKL